MEEIEDPTERLHEKILEEAEQKKERWSMHVALSTACIAVFAALSGLIGGNHSNEALIDQIKASDQWAYYQSKGIKSEITSSRNSILSMLLKQPIPMADSAAVQKYEVEKERIKATAEEDEKNSKSHLEKHIILSRAVTLFQIAIAISAISILTKRKLLWLISVGLATVGLIFFLQGTISG